MQIAVVILNWNGELLLERYLGTVIEYSPGADIYVVDNASTDGSVAYIKNNHPEVKVIVNSENGGFTTGYNLGLRTIEADVYCLLNSDVEVSPDWLIPIEKLFQENKEEDIMQIFHY